MQDVEAPVNTTAPSILGTAQEGRLLTATNGAWDNAPTSYARQWQRASDGAFADIAGAMGPSYLLSPGDVGHSVRIVVMASNAGGESQPAASSMRRTPPITTFPNSR